MQSFLLIVQPNLAEHYCKFVELFLLEELMLYSVSLILKVLIHIVIIMWLHVLINDPQNYKS